MAPTVFSQDQIGTPYRCPCCHREHPLIQPHLEGDETAAAKFVYVQCQQGLFFVGQVVEQPLKSGRRN